MKCFHHNDLDGYCSGAIVKLAHPECECFEINYDIPFPHDKIEKNEQVFVVDYSFSGKGNDDFNKLLAKTQYVTWIDHHKTSIEQHPDKAHLSGIRVDDKPAACELCWEHFFPGSVVPVAVKLLGDYDTWTFAYGTKTKEFQEGMKVLDHGPEAEVWKHILSTQPTVNEVIARIRHDGIVCLVYKEQRSKALMRAISFATEFEGYKAIACNVALANSQMFDSVSEDYDIMLPFSFNGYIYTVSIYTLKPDIDCSEIAKKYGGGGHRQASGFQCDKLPFERT